MFKFLKGLPSAEEHFHRPEPSLKHRSHNKTNWHVTQESICLQVVLLEHNGSPLEVMCIPALEVCRQDLVEDSVQGNIQGNCGRWERAELGDTQKSLSNLKSVTKLLVKGIIKDGLEKLA